VITLEHRVGRWGIGVDAAPAVEELAASAAAGRSRFDGAGFDALFDQNYDRAVRLWPYLRIAVINAVRSSARHNRVAERHEQTRTAAPVPAPADSVIVEREAVAAALAQLPVRQRTALVLRYFEDLTHDECAKAMRCTVGTAKSTTARALVALRAVLEGQRNDARE
jgi:RNA polymerase sigma factor (sigma-70 family)